MGGLRTAHLICAIIALCGRLETAAFMRHCSSTAHTLQGEVSVAAGTRTVTTGYARSLKQSPTCITSTTTVNTTTPQPATDPLCLKVGERTVGRNNRAKDSVAVEVMPSDDELHVRVGDFSVLCPQEQPCACPTLNYVNVTAASNNLLGCYHPSQYFCSTVGPQWAQTAMTYGHNALVEGSGQSNVGVCWNQGKPSPCRYSYNTCLAWTFHYAVSCVRLLLPCFANTSAH